MVVHRYAAAGDVAKLQGAIDHREAAAKVDPIVGAAASAADAVAQDEATTGIHSGSIDLDTGVQSSDASAADPRQRHSTGDRDNRAIEIDPIIPLTWSAVETASSSCQSDCCRRARNQAAIGIDHNAHLAAAHSQRARSDRYIGEQRTADRSSIDIEAIIGTAARAADKVRAENYRCGECARCSDHEPMVPRRYTTTANTCKLQRPAH